MDDNEHEEEVGLGHIVANLWPRKMIFDLLPDDVQFCAVVAGATLQHGLGPADNSVVSKAGAPLAGAAHGDEGAVIISATEPRNIFPLDRRVCRHIFVDIGLWKVLISDSESQDQGGKDERLGAQRIRFGPNVLAFKSKQPINCHILSPILMILPISILDGS